MRYTTLIDISQDAALYRNHSVRLIYLHLALKSGYHDNDRDKIRTSIRRLAAEVGISVAATRHGLNQLKKAGLLSISNEAWIVKKWVLDEKPGSRTQPKSQPKSDNSLRRAMDEQEDFNRRLDMAAQTCTREQLQTWLQELEDGKARIHCGIRLNVNERSKEWLRARIEEKERE